MHHISLNEVADLGSAHLKQTTFAYDEETCPR